MALDVGVVVAAEAEPGGGVEEEGHRLEDDGQAHVEPAVRQVVVEQARASVAAVRAPEQARGVDARPEDQGRRDEAWEGNTKGLLFTFNSFGLNASARVNKRASVLIGRLVAIAKRFHTIPNRRPSLSLR